MYYTVGGLGFAMVVTVKEEFCNIVSQVLSVVL